MEHIYEKSRNIYEQLGSIRMSRAQHREAIAQMQQAEAIADLILSAARFFRRAPARADRV